jgi:hypothetical protein
MCSVKRCLILQIDLGQIRHFTFKQVENKRIQQIYCTAPMPGKLAANSTEKFTKKVCLLAQKSIQVMSIAYTTAA